MIAIAVTCLSLSAFAADYNPPPDYDELEEAPPPPRAFIRPMPLVYFYRQPVYFYVPGFGNYPIGAPPFEGCLPGFVWTGTCWPVP